MEKLKLASVDVLWRNRTPKQFQQKSEKVFREHRQHADSLLIREAQNEIFHTDLDMEELEHFVNRMDEDGVRIVHSRVTLPSALGMNLYMAAFEDLLSMRTRAYLVKDIDPEILRRLLGGRSRATDLDEQALRDFVPEYPSISLREGVVDTFNGFTTLKAEGRLPTLPE